MITHYSLLMLILLSLFMWWCSSNAFPLDYNNNNNNNTPHEIIHQQSSVTTTTTTTTTNGICHHRMTYNEIISSLTKTPCILLIETKETNKRMKRDPTATGGNFDIYALQTTINDHRSMINYLMNNSVNFTVVADAISDHHSRTGPILTSWRDLTLLIIQIIIFSIIIYFLFCYIGCRPMDNLFQRLFKPVNNRLQQQQQQKQPPLSTISQNLGDYYQRDEYIDH